MTAPRGTIYLGWPARRIEADLANEEDEEEENELEDWSVPVAPFKKSTPWCKSVHRFEWRLPQLKRRKLKGTD